MAASPTCGGTGHMLPAERAKASFNFADLVQIMGGKRRQLAAKFRDELFNKPPFTEERDDFLCGYQELYEKKMDRVIEAMKIVRSNKEFKAAHTSQKVAMGSMFGTASIMNLHFMMFLTYIRTNASEDQQRKWLAPALAGQFNGAYAQTELGHGSNVRGLETTATYDKATEEFVIHSPKLTSLKWWPTSMYSATHAAVFGRLLIDGKDYGYHAFLVQLRDTEGRCMPGVEVGEIGPKITSKHVNIGYARFTHVRVPRFNMFARNQQVDKDGTYHAAKKKVSKFKYISMMHVRVDLVGSAFDTLAKAATIAIRYSCVRKQGFKDTTLEGSDALSSGEHTVMDYKVQQYRLFKALSLSYMFYWNSRFIRDYLMRVQADVMKGDESKGDEMPELHATLSGLKVWSTVWAHLCMEDCRKACGGQGFLLSSGITELPRSFADPVTVEGEQVILSLQVARFLLKAVTAAREGGVVLGSVMYLKEPPLGPVDLSKKEGRAEVLLALLKHRARRVSIALDAAFTRAQAKGKTFDQALNSVAVRCYRAAECHSAFVMARNNFEAIVKYVQNPSVRAVSLRLFELMVLQQIRENAGDWGDVLSMEQQDVVQDLVEELLDQIRPDAIALTDAFQFSDHDLKSTLGRYDGNVYEAIYEEAKRNPLNKTDKMVGWDKYKTMLNMKFLEMTAKGQRQAQL